MNKEVRIEHEGLKVSLRLPGLTYDDFTRTGKHLPHMQNLQEIDTPSKQCPGPKLDSITSCTLEINRAMYLHQIS